jgi:hypothetical protein
MGLMERFESSLQSLRGPNVDINIESQEIKVLKFFICLIILIAYHLDSHFKFLNVKKYKIMCLNSDDCTSTFLQLPSEMYLRD